MVMKIFKQYIKVLILAICSQPLSSWAWITGLDNLTLTPTIITYAGPMDTSVTPLIIGPIGGISSNATMIKCDLAGCIDGYFTPNPGLSSSGLQITINGNTYNIFNTGVTGLGFIVAVKDINSSNWIPVSTSTIHTFSNLWNIINFNAIGLSAQVTYVKTSPRLMSGTYSVPGFNIGYFNGSDITGMYDATKRAVNIAATTFNVNATSCSIASSKAIAIPIGDYAQKNFTGVGALVGSATANIDLICASNVVLKATVTDQSNISNRSDIINLSSGSTAKGVGFKLFYNGMALYMGPDSSIGGNINQFSILTTNATSAITVPLTARFVQTSSSVSSGTANALISITFSYQ